MDVRRPTRRRWRLYAGPGRRAPRPEGDRRHRADRDAQRTGLPQRQRRPARRLRAGAHHVPAGHTERPGRAVGVPRRPGGGGGRGARRGLRRASAVGAPARPRAGRSAGPRRVAAARRHRRRRHLAPLAVHPGRRASTRVRRTPVGRGRRDRVRRRRTPHPYGAPSVELVGRAGDAVGRLPRRIDPGRDAGRGARRGGRRRARCTSRSARRAGAPASTTSAPRSPASASPRGRCRLPTVSPRAGSSWRARTPPAIRCS